MPRELTDTDDSPAAEHDADEPTALDAGCFLARLWDRVSVKPPYHLPLCVAVEALREGFGGRFLLGPPGWQGIDPAVLDALARRVGPSVVFDPAERGWRWRYQGDQREGDR
jgi:hypothetical protein